MLFGHILGYFWLYSPPLSTTYILSLFLCNNDSGYIAIVARDFRIATAGVSVDSTLDTAPTANSVSPLVVFLTFEKLYPKPIVVNVLRALNGFIFISESGNVWFVKYY